MFKQCNSRTRRVARENADQRLCVNSYIYLVRDTLVSGIIVYSALNVRDDYCVAMRQELVIVQGQSFSSTYPIRLGSQYYYLTIPRNGEGQLQLWPCNELSRLAKSKRFLSPSQRGKAK